MNKVSNLFPSNRERTFQLKARKDTGTAAPLWQPPQFVTCKQCERRATRQVWARSQYVCPNCGTHQPIGGYYRLSLVLDHGSFQELDGDLKPRDVLDFPGYEEKLSTQQSKTGLKDSSRSGEACDIMKLTAQDLYEDGIVEEVIPEPLGGAQRDHDKLFAALDLVLQKHLARLSRMSGRALADQRYKKFRQIGEKG